MTEAFLSCEFPGYMSLWPIEEVAEYNSDYEVPNCAPGFLCFGGSDGELLAFNEQGEVVCLPAIGMEPAQAVPVAQSWEEFERFIEKAT